MKNRILVFLLSIVCLFSCKENESARYLSIIESSDSIIESVNYANKIRFIFNMRYDGRVELVEVRNLLNYWDSISDQINSTTNKNDLLSLAFNAEEKTQAFEFLKQDYYSKEQLKEESFCSLKEKFVDQKYFLFKKINKTVDSPCIIFSMDRFITPYDSLVNGDLLKINTELLNSTNYLIDSLKINGKKIDLNLSINLFSNELKEQIPIHLSTSKLKTFGDSLVITAYFKNEFGQVDSIKSEKLKVFY